MTKLLEITLKEFPTHIAITDNKYKANKYIKINSQVLYNNKLQTFSRAIAVENLHKYILKNITKYNVIDYPVKIHYTFYHVINNGDISRRKDTEGVYSIRWKEPSPTYEPKNDLDNMNWIWIKTIQDCIVKSGIIGNDTLNYVNGFKVDYEQVDKLEDRCIKVEIYKK